MRRSVAVAVTVDVSVCVCAYHAAVGLCNIRGLRVWWPLVCVVREVSGGAAAAILPDLGMVGG